VIFGPSNPVQSCPSVSQGRVPFDFDRADQNAQGEKQGPDRAVMHQLEAGLLDYDDMLRRRAEQARRKTRISGRPAFRQDSLRRLPTS